MEKEEIEKVDLVLLMLEGQAKQLLEGIGLARTRLRKELDSDESIDEYINKGLALKKQHEQQSP